MAGAVWAGSAGADCPDRFGGGLAIVDAKSRACRRVIGVPDPLVKAIKEHRKRQRAERELAANLWKDGGWMFAQPTGSPVDPRADYQQWRDLLNSRGGPGQSARRAHTAATMLLVLKVPIRAVMDVMGGRTPA